MSFRTTIVLIVIFLILVGFLYFDKQMMRKKEDRELESKQIYTVNEDELKSITLMKKGEEEIVIERTEGEWRLVRPVQARCDQSLIRDISKSLTDPLIDKKLDAGEDLAAYGLNDPFLQVRIKTKDEGELPVLSLGNRNPSGMSNYAGLSESDELLLVDTIIRSRLDQSLYDLRDKSVMDVDMENTVSIEIVGKEQTIRAEKRSGEWMLLKPGKNENVETVRADSQAIEEWLIELDNAEVKEFIAEEIENPDMYGFQEPVLKVRAISKEAEGLSGETLVFGDERFPEESSDETEEKPRADGIYARLEGRENVILLGTNLLDNLDKNFDELRNKSILHFDRNSIARIELRKPRQKEDILIERKEQDQWYMLKPFQTDADAGTINSWLWDLEELEAESFIDEPKSLEDYGLDAPLITVRLWMSAEESEPTVLKIGKGPDAEDKFYAVTSLSETVYEISEETKNDLDKTVFDLRNKTAVEYSRMDLRELRVFVESPEKQLMVEGDGRKFKGRTLEGDELSKEQIDDLIWAFDSVQYKEIIDEAPEGADDFGLESPRIRAEIELEDQDPKVLLIGDEDEDSGMVYVKLEKDKKIGLVDKVVFADLFNSDLLNSE